VGENVLAGQALAGLLHITYAEAVVIACFATWLVVFFGYRIMHDFNRVVAVLSLILFAFLLVRLIQHTSGPTKLDLTAFSFPAWLAFFSINVSGQVGWAPYVSDYSRYLPEKTSLRQAFWYTYLGSVSSAIIFATLGALAGALALNNLENNTVGYLAGLVPHTVWPATIILLLAIVAGNAINLYSPLVDYYVIRRGRYNVSAIFQVDGEYGRVDWRTIAVFLAGIAAEVPFMNATYPKFEGPVAHALSGADISWLVGFVVAGALYYLSARYLSAHPRPAAVAAPGPA
jgi:nucleobase:cation symporter-1, NCS1 family